MKHFTLIILVVLACSAVLAAQAPVGNVAYVPSYDVLGAHNNGGRGCAGCHAPHSGGRGSGGPGVVGTGLSLTPNGTAEGDSGLWGTDTNPIQTGYAGTITFNGKYPVSLGGLDWSSPLYTGVATCLSCHDGNVSKGAMMSGISYEQQFGILPSGNLTNGTLYGNNPIPTLLGSDGGVLGDYNNDHPVGPAANIGAAGHGHLPNGLVLTITAGALNVQITPGSAYAAFVNSYGYPAINSLAVDSTVTTGTAAYITCTTCHNQHNMLVYGGGYGQVGIAQQASTARFATYFFVNGPYNPGAPFDAKHPPSTMQFCRQCHFSWSNENYGLNLGTAF